MQVGLYLVKDGKGKDNHRRFRWRVEGLMDDLRCNGDVSERINVPSSIGLKHLN